MRPGLFAGVFLVLDVPAVLPGWKMVGRHSPGCTSAFDPARARPRIQSASPSAAAASEHTAARGSPHRARDRCGRRLSRAGTPSAHAEFAQALSQRIGDEQVVAAFAVTPLHAARRRLGARLPSSAPPHRPASSKPFSGGTRVVRSRRQRRGTSSRQRAQHGSYGFRRWMVLDRIAFGLRS